MEHLLSLLLTPEEGVKKKKKKHSQHNGLAFIILSASCKAVLTTENPEANIIFLHL